MLAAFVSPAAAFTPLSSLAIARRSSAPLVQLHRSAAAVAMQQQTELPTSGNGATVLAFFESWNERDMEKAVNLFSENVVYEDTVYPDVFNGREALRAHLLRVADALPSSFSFVVDDLSSGAADARAYGVRWHVESNGKALPFTRGASFYTFDSDGKIDSGFDLVEPSFKPGDATLALLSLASKVLKLLGR